MRLTKNSKECEMPVTDEREVVLVLVGPTGVGKTYLSTLIAEKLPVEIVSADSRQVYKNLDIGTAKPPLEIRKKIPHHFVDVLEPDQYFSAGEYGKQARCVIDEILSRKKIPLIVGGSGLYIKALLEMFFEEDIRDFKIRESLQERLKQEGPAALHKDLQKVDPESAKKIHPNDSQRILRALEVYLACGIPLSSLQHKKLPPPSFKALKFGITKNRKTLYSEINKRVEQMFQQGLLFEVAHLLEMGYEKNLNSLNTVGYKEVIQYLEGQITYDKCVELVKRNSRRYAKRQYTWFNADKEIIWLSVDKEEQYHQAAQKIVDIYYHFIQNEENQEE